MADSIKIIDPYESYEMTPQADAEGIYGNDFLNAVKSLQVGFGSQVLRVDRQGIWLGAADFASAPFSVDMAGNMVATSLDLSNYLQVGEALADVQGDIFDLSDIDTDLGVITAGTLIGIEVRGSLIRTSTSGGRVEIDDSTDNIEIYDSGGVKRIELDNDELIFYNSSGAERGGITANTTEIYISALNGGNLHLEALGSAYTIIMEIAGSIKAYFTTNGLTMNDDIEMSGNDINGVDRVEGTSGYIDYSAGDIKINDRFLGVTDNTYDLGATDNKWNDIYVSDVNYDTLSLMSDKKLKENIIDLSYGLAQINSLKPVSFNYKKREVVIEDDIRVKEEKQEKDRARLEKNLKKHSERKHLGFIAQEVQKIMPELVYEREDKILTLNNTEIIAVLVKAVQELSSEVESLKNK